MEGDRLDPWATIDRLFRQLPIEVRQPLTDWLGGLTTNDVRAYAGLAEAQGTALPVAIRVEPAILKLSAGEVTLSTGTATGNVGFTGHATGTTVHSPFWNRPDLLLSAMVVVYVCLAYVCLTSRPLPESLIEPLAGALGLLAWVYDRE